jgi:cation diffusion facilitator CzcD-associated flavoprotein CzcO
VTAAARPGAAGSLAELEARVAYELQCTQYPDAPWVPAARDASGRTVHAVLIVGGGQAGLALAFALRREGVHDVVVVDRAPEGREGPWITFARMNTLRTPKYLTGPDYGVPSLTPRAWFEATHGAAAWDAMDRIPRPTWMAYLQWFRRVTGVTVRNLTEVTGFRGTAEGFVEVDLRDARGEHTVVARQLVIANGMDGGGAWYVPPQFTRELPRARWAHSSEEIDFAALRGAHVAVLGAGAAAFDAAAEALDHGATVELHHRRPELLQLQFRAWLEQAGFLAAFGDLDDARKWAVMHRLLGVGAPPPESAVQRVADRAGFEVRAASAWHALRSDGSGVLIDTSRGERRADFVVFATGVRFDLSLRPEFASLVPVAALWRDRFVPPPAQACEEVGLFPYLGRGFELTERSPGAAPWLARVRMFNYAATASLGITGASGTGLKLGLRRLVGSLVRALYLQCADQHVAALPWPQGMHAAPE